MDQRFGRPQAMAIATARGVAIARKRGSENRLILKNSRGKQPQGHDTEQEPVEVDVELADMQRAGAEPEGSDDAGRAAHDETGEENLLEEVEQQGEALLHLVDVPLVDLVEPE